jgi:hypothetical protein
MLLVPAATFSFSELSCEDKLQEKQNKEVY